MITKFLFVCFLSLLCIPVSSFDYSPLIYINGWGDAALEVEHSRNDCLFYGRQRERLWVNIPDAIIVDPCFYRLLTLDYNGGSRKFSNAPNSNISTLDFGTMNGINYMDKIFGIPVSMSSVTKLFVEMMVDLGYTPGKNFRGAPYDWRYPSHDLMYQLEYGKALQKLVEETYTINGNETVWLVSHSFGGVVLHQFFDFVDQEWAEKYVAGIITAGAPFAGLSVPLRGIVSGSNFEVPIFNPEKCKKVARTLGSIYYLLPHWPKTAGQNLFYTQHRNYTGSDFGQLFLDTENDIGFSIYTEARKNAHEPLGQISHVKKHVCIYGSGVDTELAYEYMGTGGLNEDPTRIIYGDGDGRVNFESASLCASFSNVIPQPVRQIEHRKFFNSPHVPKIVLQYLKKE